MSKNATWGRDEETKKRKKLSCVKLAISPDHQRRCSPLKFCVRGRIREVIIYVKFHENRSRGLGAVGGSKIDLSHWQSPWLIQQLVLPYKPWYWVIITMPVSRALERLRGILPPDHNRIFGAYTDVVLSKPEGTHCCSDQITACLFFCEHQLLSFITPHRQHKNTAYYTHRERNIHYKN